MSESIFNIQPPEWLQQRAMFDEQSANEAVSTLAGELGSAIGAGKQTLTKGGSFLDNWHNAYEKIADPYFDIKRKSGELNLETTKAGLDQQNFSLDQQKGEVAAWQKDMPTFSKWMSLTPEQRLTAPAPVPASQQGIKILQQTEMNDDRVLQQKQALQIRSDNSKAQLGVQQRITEWTGSFAQSSPQAQAGIAALGNDAYETDMMTGKKVPSLAAITILDQDRATKGLPPFGSSPAEIAAFSREKVAKANIASKEKIAGDKNAPQIQDIGDGVKLAWMPGGKSIHVIKSDGTKNQMTPTQMENIAKGLLQINPDDANGKAIMDFLGTKAAQQSTSSTNNEPLKVGGFTVTPVNQ